MEEIRIDDIFAKLMADEKFRNDYLLAYLDRFVYSATDLEQPLDASARKKTIQSLLEAFDVLKEFEDTKMSPYDLDKVGDAVNKDSGISGFRRVIVSAGKYADWTPVLPRQIIYALYSLLDNYYNIWVDRDVYEKEAAFHISFMRIHPFEDGNKRTAKVILNSNLIRQNHPPVIISEGDTEEYYNYINNEDVVGFAKFLRLKSLNELNTMMSYYKIAKKIPIEDSVVDVIQEDNEKEVSRNGRR